MKPNRFRPLLTGFVALFALQAAAAQAGIKVELVVFQQTEVTGNHWRDSRQLPPCHAVALRDGGGAESAFGSGGECVRVAGHDPAYTGFSAISAQALPTMTGKLRAGGFTPLLNRSWIQSSSRLAPVMLRGGRVQAGRQELAGTVLVGGSDRAPEVTLDLTLTRLDGERPQYVTLKESRRVAFGEANYFDHPYFGVILLLGEQP